MKKFNWKSSLVVGSYAANLICDSIILDGTLEVPQIIVYLDIQGVQTRNTAFFHSLSEAFGQPNIRIDDQMIMGNSYSSQRCIKSAVP